MRKFVAKAQFMMRFAAGLLFWLHALLMISPQAIQPSIFLNPTGANGAESLILTMFLLLVILNTYGLGRFLLDVLFIYAFPFIVMYFISKLVLLMLRWLYKAAVSLSNDKDSESSWSEILNESLFSTVIDLKRIQTATPENPEDVEEEKESHEASTKQWLGDLLEKLSFPFRGLTILWCMLAFFTDQMWLSISAIVLVSIHGITFLFSSAKSIFRFYNSLRGFRTKVITWLDNEIEKHHKSLSNQKEGAIQNYGVLLALYRLICIFILKRSEAPTIFLIIGIAVYCSIFLKLVLVCGFLYASIAKLYQIKFGLDQAIVASLFMPFSYGDLPQCLPVKIISGVQSMAVTALGIGLFFTILFKKIGELQEIASVALTQLDKDEVRAILEKKLTNKSLVGEVNSEQASG